MLARIHKSARAGLLVFALSAGSAFVSCVNKPEARPLVDDPNGSRESTIPWNKQEKWEQGSVPGITDRPH